MKLKRTMIFAAAAAFSSTTMAFTSGSGPNWYSGNVVQITATPYGVVIKLDNATVPTNCTNPAYGEVYIPESDKSMVAMMLMAYANDKPVELYTTGVDSTGYCVVNGVNPSS